MGVSRECARCGVADSPAMCPHVRAALDLVAAASRGEAASAWEEVLERVISLERSVGALRDRWLTVAMRLGMGPELARERRTGRPTVGERSAGRPGGAPAEEG